MKNKPKDIAYCGVREDTILDAHPEFDSKALNTFLWYIQERYQIHLKKDVKHMKPPYTDSKVLQDYRFTNVRREQDRETMYLIKHVSTANMPIEQKLYNTILFRIYSKHETFEMFGGPVKFDKNLDIKEASEKAIAYSKEHPDYSFFTNAFLSSGLKASLHRMYPSVPFVPALPIRLVKTLCREGIAERILSCRTPKKVYKTLKDVYGISDFMAYQIFVDFTYIPEFPFSENEFVVAGLGCKRGIDCLFTEKDSMSDEECLFWLRDNWKKLKKINKANGYNTYFDPKELMTDLPEDERTMNVMSLENCFCEFYKYWKTTHGQGRPRSRYRATKRHKEV